MNNIQEKADLLAKSVIEVSKNISADIKLTKAIVEKEGAERARGNKILFWSCIIGSIILFSGIVFLINSC